MSNSTKSAPAASTTRAMPVVENSAHIHPEHGAARLERALDRVLSHVSELLA